MEWRSSKLDQGVLVIDVVDIAYEAFDSVGREVEEQFAGVLKTLQHSLLKL